MSGPIVDPEDLPETLPTPGPGERVCPRGHLAQVGRDCVRCGAYRARRRRLERAFVRHWHDNADVWGPFDPNGAQP